MNHSDASNSRFHLPHFSLTAPCLFRPAAQLSQQMKPETVLMVKPAVQALTQWCAACRQAGPQEAEVGFR